MHRDIASIEEEFGCTAGALFAKGLELHAKGQRCPEPVRPEHGVCPMTPQHAPPALSTGLVQELNSIFRLRKCTEYIGLALIEFDGHVPVEDATVR